MIKMLETLEAVHTHTHTHTHTSILNNKKINLNKVNKARSMLFFKYGFVALFVLLLGLE